MCIRDRVKVVGVLMGDDDGIEAGEFLEAGREAARIDEDPPVGHLDEHARMPQVSDAHGSRYPGSRHTRRNRVAVRRTNPGR